VVPIVISVVLVEMPSDLVCVVWVCSKRKQAIAEA
jgi:hypothetical protein